MPPSRDNTSAAASRRRAGTGEDALPSRALLLARTLADAVMAGRLPVGEPLPADADLAAEHHVSRAVASEALARLESLGLIARARGRPPRVIASDIRAQYEIGPRAADISEGGYRAATTIEFDRQRRVEADSELSALVGAAEGSTWLCASGLRIAPEVPATPISHITAWLAIRTDRLADPQDLNRAWIEAQTGVAVADVTEHVTAGVLTPMQGRALQTRGGTPCLHLMRRYLRAGGAVFAAVRDTHPAERVLVSVRLRPAPAKPERALHATTGEG